jgi:hypothetical protein
MSGQQNIKFGMTVCCTVFFLQSKDHVNATEKEILVLHSKQWACNRKITHVDTNLHYQ